MRPPKNMLPYVNNNFMNTLFMRSLSVKNILVFFKRLLLDGDNLMLSVSRNKLVEVGYAMTQLIYPFKYEFAFIPYLPDNKMDFLCPPVPFIIGIEDILDHHGRSTKRNMVTDAVNDGTYIIDLDSNKITEKTHSSITVTPMGKKHSSSEHDMVDLPQNL